MSAMKILIVCVLGCAMVGLTKAAAPPGEEAKDDKTEKTDLVKRYLFCHSGWTKINGACFKYVSQHLTWAKAEKNCQTMGGHLASVESKKEYLKIQKLTSPNGYRETWIGGSDAQEENVWLWVDGEKFVYTNWCKGEPSNFRGKQHCLAMNHTVKKCWDDVECYFHRPSICARRGWGLVG
ncbi:Type-2 ice-structuring protein Type II antifreeze protein [Channa argus]|uniref:Type-2 ice-structuring protein Type II antifreeze protein n=1 Tax=Channa argus TaxID=215402 RepID=A0A6G1Q778_CHAAH|nr:Type-2 ice-structuring protein Type II antifreeze protein [Channa argus]